MKRKGVNIIHTRYIYLLRNMYCVVTQCDYLDYAIMRQYVVAAAGQNTWECVRLYKPLYV